eukprot:m.102750 g.102750  ORF g.102750 m.102750 type:complete len:125 (+) comp20835_c0_seq3:135-509(+)
MNNEGASVCSAAVGLWLDEAGRSIDAVVSLTRWHSHRLNLRQQCTLHALHCVSHHLCACCMRGHCALYTRRRPDYVARVHSVCRVNALDICGALSLSTDQCLLATAAATAQCRVASLAQRTYVS